MRYIEKHGLVFDSRAEIKALVAFTGDKHPFVEIVVSGGFAKASASDGTACVKHFGSAVDLMGAPCESRHEWQVSREALAGVARLMQSDDTAILAVSPKGILHSASIRDSDEEERFGNAKLDGWVEQQHTLDLDVSLPDTYTRKNDTFYPVFLDPSQYVRVGRVAKALGVPFLRQVPPLSPDGMTRFDLGEVSELPCGKVPEWVIGVMQVDTELDSAIKAAAKDVGP